jgi:hypothetical protein
MADTPAAPPEMLVRDHERQAAEQLEQRKMRVEAQASRRVAGGGLCSPVRRATGSTFGRHHRPGNQQPQRPGRGAAKALGSVCASDSS